MAIGDSPIAAAPIAAGPDSGPSPNVDLADAMVGGDTTDFLTWILMRQSIGLGGTFDPDVLANLIEHLVATGSATYGSTLQGTASAGIGMMDSTLAAWHLLLESDLATAGSAVGDVHKLAAIVDALAATGQANGQLSAFSACVAAIAMEGLIAQGFSVNLVDATTLADATAGVARMLAPLLDSVAVTATGAPTLRLSVVSSDTLALDDDFGAQLAANADLADGLLLYVNLRLGDTDYAGWVLNTDSKAATEYRNFPFDSFATFKGKHYAAGPGGIARITGDTDDGANIDAWLRTTLTHFGTGKMKRCPDAYLGITASGDMRLKVVTFDPSTGLKSEDWYAVTKRQAAGPGNATVAIGRGLKSVWWQYEIQNIDGADFALDSLQLRPIILDRRT